ncbi:hypothetical protein [Massilia glaciei]|uniref:Uncharacterized protein n=1 Tax=Massilia glaciei TaxID=1524097 RepID=A0A2U2HG92_9BURK|nr:hypothetical protein [Massilia glaciei]PWF43685.1 hypothetical protein C7C56_020550 [Massilia glaciei]
MRTKKMAVTYAIELMAAMFVYAALLVATIKFGRPMQEGLLRTLVLLSPMLGFVLAGWAILRHFRRTDEYMRQNALESVAITAAITAALTFSYGFLETAGYPRLSMFWVWPVMGAVWALVLAVQAWRMR